MMGKRSEKEKENEKMHNGKGQADLSNAKGIGFANGIKTFDIREVWLGIRCCCY